MVNEIFTGTRPGCNPLRRDCSGPENLKRIASYRLPPGFWRTHGTAGFVYRRPSKRSFLSLGTVADVLPKNAIIRMRDVLALRSENARIADALIVFLLGARQEAERIADGGSLEQLSLIHI